jgi:hypothetical protein
VFGFQRDTVKGEDEEEEDSPKGLLGGGAANPNRQPKPAERMIKVKNLDSTAGTATADAGMNRKER